jgi:hypothetical protein
MMKANIVNNPITTAEVSFQPEFTDHKGVRALYGLSRTPIS